MGEKQGRILGIVMTCLLVLSILIVVKESAEYVSVLKENGTKETRHTIVIDPGHGGNDPGKVAINSALEQEDMEVVMTRQEDKGLYEETDSNKKVHDMKNRLAIMEGAKPALVVSVHQNSYPEESVSGVQVFYYRDSAEGKRAALLVQEQMIATLQPAKEREAKENSTYYILKKTTVPTIIVECGFLSNREEADRLTSEDYQERVAWAIHLGIMRYINSGA